MGKVLSSFRHPLRNFNVEDRAHKVIGQSKPLPAPKHAKEKINLEKILEEHPEIVEESRKKIPELDKNLRDVYVTSRDHNAEIPTNPDRPLPVERNQPPNLIFGIMEPEKVPLGKTTLRKALKFLTDHQADPKAYPIEKIAEDYLLPEGKVRSIVKYFKVFELYMPREKKVKATFVGPAVQQIRIEKISRDALPSGSSKKDET